MPLYWVAAARAGQAAAMTQAAQQNLMAGLAAASWIIGAGIAYWFGDDQPRAIVDVSIDFDPAPSWQCASHPFQSCYGDGWCEQEDLL